MKTLIFLRHGKTAYTGQFPDLTEEGHKEICQASEEIVDIVGTRKNVRIVSSPLPRGLGTADIIARRLGYEPASIEKELAIRCMDFLDVEKASALFKRFATARDVDIAYAEAECFEAGDAVEKRSVIQHRFFSYLGRLFEWHLQDKLPEVTIHTSHYEVLWYLAKTFDFNQPLKHGEIIRIDLSRCSPGGYEVVIEGMFRGRQKMMVCSGPTEAFRNQFSLPGALSVP